MDKTIIVSLIAKNGLDTAQTALELKAATLGKQAEKATEQADKDRLSAQSKKLLKLVAALNAAETGLEQYLEETAGL